MSDALLAKIERFRAAQTALVGQLAADAQVLAVVRTGGLIPEALWHRQALSVWSG